MSKVSWWVNRFAQGQIPSATEWNSRVYDLLAAYLDKALHPITGFCSAYPTLTLDADAKAVDYTAEGFNQGQYVAGDGMFLFLNKGAGTYYLYWDADGIGQISTVAPDTSLLCLGRQQWSGTAFVGDPSTVGRSPILPTMPEIAAALAAISAAVLSVAGVGPDESGDVPLTAGDIGAEAAGTAGTALLAHLVAWDHRQLALARPPVLASVAALPETPEEGDRYRLTATANEKKLAEWDGESWIYTTPTAGMRVYDLDAGLYLEFAGDYPAGDWAASPAASVVAGGNTLTPTGTDVDTFDVHPFEQAASFLRLFGWSEGETSGKLGWHYNDGFGFFTADTLYKLLRRLPQSFSGEGAPALDISDGVQVLDRYVDTLPDPHEEYWCEDNAEGAPVWHKFGGGGGSGDATSIQGVAVDPTAPEPGQVLAYDEGEEAYVPVTPAGGDPSWALTPHGRRLPDVCANAGDLTPLTRLCALITVPDATAYCAIHAYGKIYGSVFGGATALRTYNAKTGAQENSATVSALGVPVAGFGAIWLNNFDATVYRFGQDGDIDATITSTLAHRTTRAVKCGAYMWVAGHQYTAWDSAGALYLHRINPSDNTVTRYTLATDVSGLAPVITTDGERVYVLFGTTAYVRNADGTAATSGTLTNRAYYTDFTGTLLLNAEGDTSNLRLYDINSGVEIGTTMLSGSPGGLCVAGNGKAYVLVLSGSYSLYEYDLATNMFQSFMGGPISGTAYNVTAFNGGIILAEGSNFHVRMTG
jgi:hypothetical protein